MRITFAALLTFVVAALGGSIAPVHADPYRWCAIYAGKGVTNCGFLTVEQCRAAISGNGGFCNPNTFYDGRPVTTPEDGVRRAGRRAVH